MSLVLFTGFVGMVLAPGALHPLLFVVALLCMAVGAGASGAINMWYDRDIDIRMARTKGRPLPTGRMAPDDALAFGVILAAGSVTTMGLAVNLMAAALLAFTIAFYVFVYTMWLKRRTPLNIVIGGAAGALPPVVGWAAVSGEVGLGPLILFAIIFLWTPPHFWALSLCRRGDYEAAGVPMLPVAVGTEVTKRRIILYSVLLIPAALGPWFIGISGWPYAAGAAVLSLLFLCQAVLVRADETDKSARRMFAFSIIYLFLLFTLLVVDRVIGVWV
jgi:protoheme IX farnesyltransferase